MSNICNDISIETTKRAWIDKITNYISYETQKELEPLIFYLRLIEENDSDFSLTDKEIEDIKLNIETIRNIRNELTTLLKETIQGYNMSKLFKKSLLAGIATIILGYGIGSGIFYLTIPYILTLTLQIEYFFDFIKESKTILNERKRK